MKKNVKPYILIISSCLLLILGTSGCIDHADAREDLSRVLGYVLQYGANESIIESIVNAVDALSNGDHHTAQTLLEELQKTNENTPLSQVIIQGPSKTKEYYRGLFCNDVCDLRVILSHIDQIKHDGFDTIWMSIQLMVHHNGTFYIPGENVYRFYLNAFHASGFTTWLSLGHTAYDFPYRWDKEPTTEYPPLASQQEAYTKIEDILLKWVTIAEQFNIDTIIPEEEANTLLLTYGANRTNLNQSDREFLNTWHQKMRQQIQPLFSGKLGFATNDGGPLEQFIDRESYPFPIGPDFNYSGFDYIITKIPFLNSFNDSDAWFFELDNRLMSCEQYKNRDNTTGVIWYEAGMPVGDSYSPNELNHRILDVNDQVFAFEHTFEYAEKYNISGIFFKPSPKQIHEGNWSFLNHPAEQILQEQYTNTGSIADKPIDNLWTALDEEGLKVIQLAIAPDIPFDPEYEIDQIYLTGAYHELEQSVDGG